MPYKNGVICDLNNMRYLGVKKDGKKLDRIFFVENQCKSVII